MLKKYMCLITMLLTSAATAYPQAATSVTLGYPGHWGHLSYTISGAHLEPPSGSDAGFIGGRQYKGTLSGLMLTVSGNAASDNESSGPGSGDYYELVVSVTVGKEHKEYSYIAPRGERLNRPFSLSVPIDSGASSGSFSIRLIEQNANYGARGWAVSGSLRTALVTRSSENSARVIGKVDVALVSEVSGRVTIDSGKDTYDADEGGTMASGYEVSCGTGATLAVVHLRSQNEYVARCPGKLLIGDEGVSGDIAQAMPLNARLPKHLDLLPRNLADATGKNVSNVRPVGDVGMRSIEGLLQAEEKLRREESSGNVGTNLSLDEPVLKLIISNGRIGLLEFARTGSGYSGRMNVTGKAWETLSNITESNEMIAFDRGTVPMEGYVGRFGNEGITGSFSIVGGNAKPWKAVIVNKPSPATTSRNDPAIDVGALDQQAISRSEPIAPPAARAVLRSTEQVVVKVLVDEVGRVASAVTISGHPLLRSAAEEAAKLANFAPMTRNGRAAKFKGTLTYRFEFQEVTPGNTVSEPQELFSNSNTYGVENGGRSPSLQFTETVTITYIMTYHWNFGRGAPTGTIGLIRDDGTIFGPWKASGTAGQGGVPSANWEVRPNMVIPAGRYQVIDSDPSTWAQNSASSGKGMVVIKGIN